MREIQYRPAPALPGTGAPSDERAFHVPHLSGRRTGTGYLLLRTTRQNNRDQTPRRRRRHTDAVNGRWKPTRHPGAW